MNTLADTVAGPHETDADKSIKAAVQKRLKLEREIEESQATRAEKSDMQHSLSKLWMFSSQAIDSLRAEIGKLHAAAEPEAKADVEAGIGLRRKTLAELKSGR